MALVIIDDDAFRKQDLALSSNFERIVGQIFRLLPMREEDHDYVKPLNTLIVELTGYSLLVPDDEKLLMLLGKLRGLKSEECVENFMLFRRMVFEACGIATDIKDSLEKEES